MDRRTEYWNCRSLDFSAPHGRLQAVARMLERVQHGASTLLDIGCAGAGLRSLLPSTIEYFGIDIAESTIAFQRDPTHFEVVDVDTATTCFAGRRFDIVVCSGIVEYIKSLDQFFGFIRNVMCPDGYLVLTFLNHDHYLDVLLHKPYTDPHVNFMSITAFVEYVRQKGFRIECETSLTVSERELPVLAHCRRFPFTLWNRNYVFLCQGEAGRLPATRDVSPTGRPVSREPAVRWSVNPDVAGRAPSESNGRARHTEHRGLEKSRGVLSTGASAGKLPPRNH